MEFLLFNIYLLILAVLYRVLFDKVGDIKWNRWLLLATPVFLYLILLINNSITTQSSLFVVELDVITIANTEQSSSNSTSSFTLYNWLMISYFLGVVAFVVFHCTNFVKLYQLKKTAKFLHNYENAKVYESSLNASFGTIIFVKENLSQEEKDILLAHEYAHVRQKHSIDRIFALIIQTICWFNPGAYLWKTDIEKNHEYLADQEVLNNTSKEEYTLFLLEQRMNLKANQLQLPLSNMSNLKSRVMRMNQKTRSVLSYLILPVLAVGMMSSKFLPATEPLVTNVEKPAQKEGEPVEDPDEMAEFEGGMDAMQTFLANEIKYPEASMKKKVEGIVFVEAVITEEGKVTKVKVLRGVDEHINAEAIRVIEAMPDWSPAKKDDQPVASFMRVPIRFTLRDREVKGKESEHELKEKKHKE